MLWTLWFLRLPFIKFKYLQLIIWYCREKYGKRVCWSIRNKRAGIFIKMVLLNYYFLNLGLLSLEQGLEPSIRQKQDIEVIFKKPREFSRIFHQTFCTVIWKLMNISCSSPHYWLMTHQTQAREKNVGNLRTT